MADTRHRRDVNVCTLERDEGIARIRVWYWGIPPPDPDGRAFHERTMWGHVAYLRRVLPHSRIWIDRCDQPAVDLPRAMDYLTFVQQREREQNAERDAREAEVLSRIVTKSWQVGLVHRRAETHSTVDHAPSLAVHIVADGEGPDRWCARCGALLQCGHGLNRPIWAPSGLHYVPGELIERGAHWQAIAFRATAPTCEAAT